jgi:hypothetical protein
VNAEDAIADLVAFAAPFDLNKFVVHNIGDFDDEIVARSE